MDERALGPVEGPLQRARLHIRGGKRRLRQAKYSAGIATLYDALSAAMQSYIASPERRRRLVVGERDNLNDDRTVYAVLVRSGVLNGAFAFDAFDRLLDRALAEEIREFDYRELVEGLDFVMTQLGVMPFDEAKLPPEDPKTF